MPAHSVGKVTQPHVQVELVGESPTVQPGSTTWLAVHFTLEPQWHIYWKNPGDSGTRPKFEWTLPSNVLVRDPVWPTPSRHQVGPLMNYGYSGEVTFLFPVEATPGLRLGEPATLKLFTSWLVCRDVCIPGKANLTWIYDVRGEVPKPEPSISSLFRRARSKVPSSTLSPPTVKASFQGAELVLVFDRLPETIGGKTPYAFIGEQNLVNYQAEQMVETNGNQTLVRVPLSQAHGDRPQRISGVLAGTSGALDFWTGVERDESFWWMLVLALLGGISLNLMPCVFPVLSIKAVKLIEQSGLNPRATRVLGLWYLAGVVVSFWVLTAVLLGLREVGLSLGWGFQLQSPPFVLFLIYILTLMGGSLLGLFELSGRFQNWGGPLAKTEGYRGAFFAGFLATVVSTPCTAPFMGSAVAYALTANVVRGFGIFTALGVGLALPYVLLSWTPALHRWLPKPGVWMERFKQLMAWPLFLTAIWLLWILGLQTGASVHAYVLATIAAMFFGIWLTRVFAKNRRGVWGWWVVLLSMVLGFYLVTQEGVGKIESSPATTVSAVTWAEVLRKVKEGKKVFVDFTAAWCVTCKVNEQLVLDRKDFQEQLKVRQIDFVKIDWTSYDPEVTRVLAQFQRSGVPLYLFFPGGDQPPVVLPQILTRDIVFEAINGKLN